MELALQNQFFTQPIRRAYKFLKARSTSWSFLAISFSNTQEWAGFILLGLLTTGLAVTAFFLFDLKKKVEKLYGTGDDTNFEKNLVARIAKIEAKLEEIEPRLKLTEEISKISVQKVGFLRFNPFQDTGGDNSFLLVMLNRENSGIVLTSLYMRGGMRIYAKSVERGKTKQQLSDEEKRVLEETINKGIANRV